MFARDKRLTETSLQGQQLSADSFSSFSTSFSKFHFVILVQTVTMVTQDLQF